MNATRERLAALGEAGARLLLGLRPDLHPQGRPALRRPDPRRRGAAGDRGRRALPPGGPGRGDRGRDQPLPRPWLSARSSSCSSAAASPPGTARATCASRAPTATSCWWGASRTRPTTGRRSRRLPARRGVARRHPVPARRVVRRAARRGADAHERMSLDLDARVAKLSEQGRGALREGAAGDGLERADPARRRRAARRHPLPAHDRQRGRAARGARRTRSGSR